MNAGPATVVSLGARGDLEEGSGGGTSCKVREFALLSDGREVTLLDDRGWGTSEPLGGTPARVLGRTNSRGRPFRCSVGPMTSPFGRIAAR